MFKILLVFVVEVVDVENPYVLQLKKLRVMTLIFLESNRTFFRHPDNPIKNLVDFLELD